MSKLVAHGSVNVGAIDLKALYRGTPEVQTAARFTVAAGNMHFAFDGENLGGFGASGFPSQGQIHSIIVRNPQGTIALSNVNLTAAQLNHFAQSGDTDGLQQVLFAGNDAFILNRSTHDNVNGGDGADTFLLGANLNAHDRIDGGAGVDVLRLRGDYSSGVHLGVHTITNIERVQLVGQHDYKVSLRDGNVAAGTTLSINADHLDPQHTLTVNGIAETDGQLHIVGGHGNDVIATGAGDDRIHAGEGNDSIREGGGADHISVGTGDDAIRFTNGFDASDRVNGGAGLDRVFLNGDYSHGVTLAANTLRNVEQLRLGANHSYDFTFSDGNIATGQTLTVNGKGLGAADKLTIDDSHESNGILKIIGGHGDDAITSGAGGSIASLGDGNDVFNAGGGVDHVSGGSGNDDFFFGANFGAADDVNGGAGSDTLHLSTPVSGLLNVALDRANMHSIEHIDLGDGNYDISVAPGGLDVANVEINALKVDVAHTVTIDGSAALATAFTLVGGAGDNILTGGAGDDTLIAGLGSNILNGGGGHDTFVFNALGGTDSIVSFDGALDKIDVGHSVTGIDTSLLGGLLNDLGGLGTLVGSLLGANHAMEISPLLGALAGQNFLVIDQNGQSGFQAGQDLVVQLENATHLGSLGLGNFGI
ncbi:MAG TPA: calcium-binding protein [Rhizomicrobium sp.]|jgi:Ca2+-binding RTX toxin-like protein|nr:calcium-binding protein [Rhizomicrobium sp.]